MPLSSETHSSADHLMLDYVESALAAVIDKNVIPFSYEQAMAGKYGAEWFHVKLLDDIPQTKKGESRRPNSRLTERTVPVWVVGGFSVGTDSQMTGKARIAAGQLIEKMKTALVSLERGISETIDSVQYRILFSELGDTHRAFNDGGPTGIVMFDLRIQLTETRS